MRRSMHISEMFFVSSIYAPPADQKATRAARVDLGRSAPSAVNRPNEPAQVDAARSGAGFVALWPGSRPWRAGSSRSGFVQHFGVGGKEGVCESSVRDRSTGSAAEGCERRGVPPDVRRPRRCPVRLLRPSCRSRSGRGPVGRDVSCGDRVVRVVRRSTRR